MGSGYRYRGGLTSIIVDVVGRWLSMWRVYGWFFLGFLDSDGGDILGGEWDFILDKRWFGWVCRG